MNFNNIIGNENLKQLFNNTICSNIKVHSYMFVGPDGIGKSLFAKDFAEKLLCLNSNKACGSCSSCVKFESGNHPDFVILDSEDGKNIKIGQVRQMQEQIAEKPIVSESKIFIINNSDLMTVEAQNCLLKTLEEPPSYAVIILLLSNENKLLNTIKSRCTKIAFKGLSNDELTNFSTLHHIDATKELLEASNGSISKLIQLSENIETYKNLDIIINKLYSSDIVDIWNNAEILYKSKDTINNLLDYFNMVFFNKLRKTNEIKYINSIKIVELTKGRLSANANYDMCIDNLLLKLWEEINENNNRS